MSSNDRINSADEHAEKEAPSLCESLQTGIGAVWSLRECVEGAEDKEIFAGAIRAINEVFACLACPSVEKELVAVKTVHLAAVVHCGYSGFSHSNIAIQIMNSCKIRLFLLLRKFYVPKTSEVVDAEAFSDIGMAAEAVRRIPPFNLDELKINIIKEHERAGRIEDSKADTKQKSDRFPENTKVTQLAKRIRLRSDSGDSQISVALDFTEGNRKEALSLLRQLRRFPHLLT